MFSIDTQTKIDILENILPQLANVIAPHSYSMMLEEFNDFKAGMYGDDIGIVEALLCECNDLLHIPQINQFVPINTSPLTDEEKIILDEAGFTE